MILEVFYSLNTWLSGEVRRRECCECNIRDGLLRPNAGASEAGGGMTSNLILSAGHRSF